MRSIHKYQLYVDRFDNHPYALPAATLLVLIFLSVATLIGLNAISASPEDVHMVEVSVDDSRESVPSRARTVEEFLKRADIELGPNDRVEPDRETRILSDGFKVNVYRARPITIIDGSKRTQVYSAEATPRSVAAQAGIKVYAEDELEQKVPDNFLREGVLGEKVVINRATPINLNLYGAPESTRTHAQTVGDLLKERGVKLARDDQVRPALDTHITANLQIFVTRSGIQIATVEEEIPMAVETIEDASLSFGSQTIRQHGSPGRKTVTYEITLQNGQEIGRRAIQEVIIAQPVTQIVARGPQGNFGQALGQLRQCEAGGRYNAVSASGTYMGAYQFNQGTWNANAPPDHIDVPPHRAPAEIQDIAATTLYQRRGWSPWPACSRKLGLQDIYR